MLHDQGAAVMGAQHRPAEDAYSPGGRYLWGAVAARQAQDAVRRFPDFPNVAWDDRTAAPGGSSPSLRQ
ncbi:hypothetical protein [Streptomyces sp. NPDC059819]|uniref:hypothetical protein n=1 Tax=Streptomyces sp. NPDC059819 TaxID=3346963 RepID=UPI00364AD99E